MKIIVGGKRTVSQCWCSTGLDEQYRTQKEKEITLSVLSCFQESVAENNSLCWEGASGDSTGRDTLTGTTRK